MSNRPLVRVCNEKLIFLFVNKNICCGYSKEPSQRDGSFEDPKHILKDGSENIDNFMLKNVVCMSEVVPRLLNFLMLNSTEQEIYPAHKC